MFTIMTIGIYSITNKINGKRYIGKSINIEKRFSYHKSSLRRTERSKDTNRHLFNAVKQYGIENFDFEIIQSFDEVDEQLISESELVWMDLFNTTNRNCGYNLRRDTSTRMVVHPETRIKQSENFTGEKNSNYGNSWTDEMKDNARRIALDRHSSGKYYNDEWKSKLSKTSSETWKDEKLKSKMAQKVKMSKRKYIFHQFDKLGNFIKTYESVEQIVSENEGFKWQNIYSVCNGYKKSYMGYVWVKEHKI